MGVEVGCMDTGIGSATAHNGHRLPQERGEGFFERKLHCGQVWLGLPSAVIGSVIG